jgi:hypothetical protein
MSYCILRREKILRLEHECRLLKMKGSEDEGVAVLQAQVEDLNQRMALEQTENRYTNLGFFIILFLIIKFTEIKMLIKLNTHELIIEKSF